MCAIRLAAVDGSSPPAKLTTFTLTAKIGYSHQADYVTWSAQAGPVLAAKLAT